MQGSAVSRDELQVSDSGHLETSDPAVRVLTAKELDRLHVIRQVLERRLTRVKAGAMLGIGARQVSRLCGAYQREGASGLASRKRGHVGNRKLPAAVETQVVELARSHYQNLGSTLVREKLAAQHGIKLAKETVRKILSKAGLWFAKTRTSQETNTTLIDGHLEKSSQGHLEPSNYSLTRNE